MRTAIVAVTCLALVACTTVPPQPSQKFEEVQGPPTREAPEAPRAPRNWEWNSGAKWALPLLAALVLGCVLENKKKGHPPQGPYSPRPPLPPCSGAVGEVPNATCIP